MTEGSERPPLPEGWLQVDALDIDAQLGGRVLWRPGRTVGAVVRHRVECIGDGNDLRNLIRLCHPAAKHNAFAELHGFDRGLDGRVRRHHQDLRPLVGRGRIDQLADQNEPGELGQQPRLTAADVAEQAGIPLERARRMWRTLGFAEHGDALAYTEADVAALRMMATIVERGGVSFDKALNMARGIGLTMARLADWQVANPSKHPPYDWTGGGRPREETGPRVS